MTYITLRDNAESLRQLGDGFELASPLADLPEGGLLGVETASGRRICLVRLADDEIRAVDDSCTHQAFPLSAGDLLPDGTLLCAWHGAHFDSRTGEVTRGPACDALRSYEVAIVDGDVWVGGVAANGIGK